MSDYLAAEALIEHVRVLSHGIGPRPAGSLDEAAARAYVRGILEAAGITGTEELPFLTPDSWGYGMIIPTLIALGSNGLGVLGKPGKLLGGLATLTSVAALWRMTGGYKGWFQSWQPRRNSATLIARIAPDGEIKRRVVLVGHTDTNKHRLTFSPQTKRFMLPASTVSIGAALLNGLAQIAEALGWQWGMSALRRYTLAGLAGGLLTLLADETGGFVDGANDNATAVACLLGLGDHLAHHRLRQTEVWLAFTGAEETGCLGMHALLDAYGDDLGDAWFIDFEMVGAPHTAYVTFHSGFAYGNGYAPDPDSLALAEQVAAQNPGLGVTGRPMVIMEEVGTLRRRDFRGICLAGVGEDGWLTNWHRYSDTLEHIDPAGIERAARFALAMIHALDGGARSNGRF